MKINSILVYTSILLDAKIIQLTIIVNLWLDNNEFVFKKKKYIHLSNKAKLKDIFISPLGARNIIKKFIQTGLIGDLRNLKSDIANTKITEHNILR